MNRTISIALTVLTIGTLSSVTHANPTTWLVRAGYDAFAAEEALTALGRAGAFDAGGAAKLIAPDADTAVLLGAYQGGALNLESLPGGARTVLEQMGSQTGQTTLTGLGHCGPACDAAAGVLQDVEVAARTAVSGSRAKTARVLGYDDYTMVSFVGGEFALPTRELQASHRSSGFGLRSVDGPLRLEVDGQTIEIPNSPLTEALMANKPTQILIEGAPSNVAGQWSLERVWVETSDGWVQLEQGPLHTIRRARVGPPEM